jgi:DUF1016 N-terminal domain
MLKNENNESLIRLNEKLHLEFAAAKYTEQYLKLMMYWEIGDFINQERKRNYGQLAMDLKKEFAELEGLSSTDLRYMREFCRTFPDFLKLRLSPAKLSDHPLNFVPLVSWPCQVVILGKVKSLKERLFYVKKAAEQGWDKSMLTKQIEEKLYESQKK